MVLGMLFENFKNYYILRYVIYEFLKKVLGVPQPTCLVRVHCAIWRKAIIFSWLVLAAKIGAIDWRSQLFKVFSNITKLSK